MNGHNRNKIWCKKFPLRAAIKILRFGVFFQSINQFKKATPVQWTTSLKFTTTQLILILRTSASNTNRDPSLTMETSFRSVSIRSALTLELRL